MRGQIRPQTLAEFKPEIDMELAPEFGDMTTEKAVMSNAGIVPTWRVRSAIGNFLRKQVDIAKRIKEKTRRRQRDIDQEKIMEVVDGRTG